MYPIRMTYKEPQDNAKEVDVYNIYTDINEGIVSCMATFWVIKDKIWLTAPIYLLTPKLEKKGKQLNE